MPPGPLLNLTLALQHDGDVIASTAAYVALALLLDIDDDLDTHARVNCLSNHASLLVANRALQSFLRLRSTTQGIREML